MVTFVFWDRSNHFYFSIQHFALSAYVFGYFQILE